MKKKKKSNNPFPGFTPNKTDPDTKFKEDISVYVHHARESRSHARYQIEKDVLDSNALRKYDIESTKMYLENCGISMRSMVARDLVNGGYNNIETFTLCVGMYKRIKKYESNPANTILAPLDLGFIYILESGGLCKIGITNNIPRRISVLQTGTPNRIKLIDWDAFSMARAAEISLHEHFAPKRISGEWFSLDMQDLSTVRGWFQKGIPTPGMEY